MKTTLSCLTLGLFLTTAQANTISGSLWFVPPSVSQNAIPANVPATAPDVTFDVNSPLNFNIGNSSSTTVAAFLGTGGAFNLVENSAGALTQDANDILVQFIGSVTVTNGQQFTVTHDDGLTLIIGGLNLNFSPLPTAPVQSLATYTGPSGTFPFQLVYGECCGGAAVLQVNLPFTQAGPTVPEPSSMILAAGALWIFAGLRRRSR